MRTFASGATRDDNANKLAFEGFLSPEVLYGYARYMHKHRKQPDGNLRAPDNWQKGIPFDALMDSLLRHVFEVWRLHRLGVTSNERAEMYEALYATMFNTMGYVFEMLKEDEISVEEQKQATDRPTVEIYRFDQPPEDLKPVGWIGEMKSALVHADPAVRVLESGPAPVSYVPINLGSSSLVPPASFAVDTWRADCEEMLDNECKGDK